MIFFFFQAEGGIGDDLVTGVRTCALPIYPRIQQPARLFGRARAGKDHRIAVRTAAANGLYQFQRAFQRHIEKDAIDLSPRDVGFAGRLRRSIVNRSMDPLHGPLDGLSDSNIDAGYQELQSGLVHGTKPFLPARSLPENVDQWISEEMLSLAFL